MCKEKVEQKQMERKDKSEIYYSKIWDIKFKAEKR